MCGRGGLTYSCKEVWGYLNLFRTPPDDGPNIRNFPSSCRKGCQAVCQRMPTVRAAPCDREMTPLAWLLVLFWAKGGLPKHAARLTAEPKPVSCFRRWWPRNQFRRHLEAWETLPDTILVFLLKSAHRAEAATARLSGQGTGVRGDTPEGPVDRRIGSRFVCHARMPRWLARRRFQTGGVRHSTILSAPYRSNPANDSLRSRVVADGRTPARNAIREASNKIRSNLKGQSKMCIPGNRLTADSKCDA